MLAKNDYNNYLNPQKEEISLSDNSSLKPMSLLKHEIVANRQKMLAPIKTKEEYDELLKEILGYEAPPNRNGLSEPVIQIFDYENADKCLKGLIAYCGGWDLSKIINCWLTGRTFQNNQNLNDEQIANIIRCMDYSLEKLDDIYGTYKGIVYRKGFFNPITDKQFYSTSEEAIKAVKHSGKHIPSSDNPYSIIKVKKGHDIKAFHLNANSCLSRNFAQKEKEILLDRHSEFRKIPECEYNDEDKKLVEMLLAQAIRKTDDISEKDLNNVLMHNQDLLKHISIWEEI
jgi:hypothetical protein